ncbi:sensor histidine kinase [Paenibacillus yanchengensis]|uniref:histidine kinase n=1 Tax=Paenibacillus yanchengensis TaxID=2035833 RepID=A0ABW4YMT4_9BACL
MDHLTIDLEEVLTNTINMMESSKQQIYHIYNLARQEMEAIQQELEQVLQETRAVIEKVDQLELDYRYSRIKLTEVNRDFERYNEYDMKQAYEAATTIYSELLVFREKETNLKSRRDDLQYRIQSAEQSIERAEMLASQMNVVLEYMSGDLTQVTRIIESAQSKQLLGLKIILAQEEERKRMAREIHDGPAQTLANLALRTEIAERMLLKEQFELVQLELSDLKGQVRAGLEEIRKIIFNLRPMALDDLGLVPALRKFAHDFEEKTKILAQFENEGRESRLPSAIEAAVFRLVQEAFSNVAKHSKATRVVLKLIFTAKAVSVLIQDNGIGFGQDKHGSAGKQASLTKSGRFGLVGMRERVELINGHIEFKSKLGEGTKIMIAIPITSDTGKENGLNEFKSRFYKGKN